MANARRPQNILLDGRVVCQLAVACNLAQHSMFPMQASIGGTSQRRMVD